MLFTTDYATLPGCIYPMLGTEGRWVNTRIGPIYTISDHCKIKSLASYIAEHMEVAGVGASIATCLYRTHDAPALLSHLLQAEPWRRITDSGDEQTFNCELTSQL